MDAAINELIERLIYICDGRPIRRAYVLILLAAGRFYHKIFTQIDWPS